MAGGTIFLALTLSLHSFEAQSLVSAALILKEKRTVQGGDSFSLYCDKNSNSVRYEPWFKDSKPVRIDHLHHFDRGNYSVDQATESDSGLYTCRKHSVRVNVTGLRFAHALPQQTYVLANHDLVLKVPVLGFDSSGRITWEVNIKKIYKDQDGKASAPSNVHVEDSTLSIVNATVKNAGTYKMQVSQNGRLLRTFTDVNVENSIEFSSILPRNMSVDVGESVVLRCKTDLKSSVNVSWFRSNNSHIVCNGNCSITEEGLEIHDASVTAVGLYVCAANNHLQLIEQSTWLTVKTPPKSLYVEVRQLMRNGYVNVSWEVQNTGGYPIKEFIIHTFPLHVDKYYYSSGKNAPMFLEDKSKTWRSFGPLNVGEMYWFEIWARNKLGDGDKVWVNFTYMGPGNYTIATEQVDSKLFFHNFYNGVKYNTHSMSDVQQVLLSSVLSMFALTLIGGLMCKIFCRMDREHAAMIRRRIRQDSEASDVLRLGNDDDPPRAPHSWSFINPMFDENLLDDTPPPPPSLTSQRGRGSIVRIDAPPTYDSLEHPMEHGNGRSAYEKPNEASFW